MWKNILKSIMTQIPFLRNFFIVIWKNKFTSFNATWKNAYGFIPWYLNIAKLGYSFIMENTIWTSSQNRKLRHFKWSKKYLWSPTFWIVTWSSVFSFCEFSHCAYNTLNFLKIFVFRCKFEKNLQIFFCKIHQRCEQRNWK
jgi:hypothetical protein